jgi:hypothetical protein
MIGKNLLRGQCLCALFVSGAAHACVDVGDAPNVLGWQHLAVLAIVSHPGRFDPGECWKS